jgi:hypothetical protein
MEKDLDYYKKELEKFLKEQREVRKLMFKIVLFFDENPDSRKKFDNFTLPLHWDKDLI